MLLYHFREACNGVFLLMTAVLVCAVLAYYVNSRRAIDDPKKKNYHPLAIILAPITFPIIFILYISFFLLRILSYGVFLTFFIFTLIFIRKPFILTGLRKLATTVGDRLLEANTVLVRFFLSPWINETEQM